MTFSVSTLCLASGAPLLFRIDSHFLRGLGAALFSVGFVMAATPAFADENILAVDNGEVRCRASKADLTRISLKDDRFVSVSRVQTGVEGQDFSIVHEPTRGDIYISVPEAYAKPNISFFGTTQKGLVYKFDCQIGGDSAVQVFVANADIENPSAKPEVLTASGSLQDRAVGLVRAMFEQRPVTVGDMKVQLLTEYRSPTMTGKVLRIENASSSPIALREELIAGDGAIAVTISNPNLASGQATAAYVVVPAGR